MIAETKISNKTLVTGTAILYVFFNTLFLPEGLYYTTLLTPVFFMGLIRMRVLKHLFLFTGITVLFFLFQIPQVEYRKDYAVSFILLQTLAVFVLSGYYYLQSVELNEVYKSLTVANIVLLFIAVLLLFSPARQLMWYLKPISPDIPVIPRLKMFTSEASYYSLVIAPLFAFYLLKKLWYNGHYNLLFYSLLLSLFMSFSLGVISAVIIAFGAVLFFNWRTVHRKINVYFLLYGVAIVVLSVVLLFFLRPHNPLFERVRNICQGKDTSFRGRTYESFEIVWNVIKMKSIWWGCGPGQFKYIGKDFFDYFYHFSDLPDSYRITNAVAETLCIYGVAGLVLRFLLIAFLFIKTKVWRNYYRQFLFVFIFIYQFTGSYLFNPAEYVIWILAFMPSVFPEFDRVKKIKRSI